MRTGAHVGVFCYYVAFCLIFPTRYVSFIQIWKTEYNRTQLPGPPEEPVSPGQGRAERHGNVTSTRMEYAYRYCFYNNTDNGSG